VLSQRNYFWSGTDPISLLICCYGCCGCSYCSSEKTQGFAISNQIGMKFGKIVLQVNVLRVIESDFWYEVTLLSWRSWCLPSTRYYICSSIRQLPASPPNAFDIIDSLCALQLLIHNTFVLVSLMDLLTETFVYCKVFCLIHLLGAGLAQTS